MENLLMNMHK